jgi:hypothetical protein
MRVRIPDGRERHFERLSDLRTGHPQPPERSDHLNAMILGAIRDHTRRRGAVQQPVRSFGAVAGDPLARGAVTDPGRLGGRAQRPPRILNASHQQLAALSD